MNYKILTLIRMFNNKKAKELIISYKKTIIIDKMGIYAAYIPKNTLAYNDKPRKNKIIINL